MATCRIKVYNPNPHDVNVKTGDSSTGSPSSYTLIEQVYTV